MFRFNVTREKALKVWINHRLQKIWTSIPTHVHGDGWGLAHFWSQPQVGTRQTAVFGTSALASFYSLGSCRLVLLAKIHNASFTLLNFSPDFPLNDIFWSSQTKAVDQKSNHCWLDVGSHKSTLANLRSDMTCSKMQTNAIIWFCQGLQPWLQPIRAQNTLYVTFAAPAKVVCT